MISCYAQLNHGHRDGRGQGIKDVTVQNPEDESRGKGIATPNPVNHRDIDPRLFDGPVPI